MKTQKHEQTIIGGYIIWIRVVVRLRQGLLRARPLSRYPAWSHSRFNVSRPRQPRSSARCDTSAEKKQVDAILPWFKTTATSSDFAPCNACAVGAPPIYLDKLFNQFVAIVLCNFCSNSWRDCILGHHRSLSQEPHTSVMDVSASIQQMKDNFFADLEALEYLQQQHEQEEKVEKSILSSSSSFSVQLQQNRCVPEAIWLSGESCGVNIGMAEQQPSHLKGRIQAGLKESSTAIASCSSAAGLFYRINISFIFMLISVIIAILASVALHCRQILKLTSRATQPW